MLTASALPDKKAPRQKLHAPLGEEFLRDFVGCSTRACCRTPRRKPEKAPKRITERQSSSALFGYITALAVLYPANFFTGQLTWSSAVLILLNGLIVALAANGGYEAINNMKKK